MAIRIRKANPKALKIHELANLIPEMRPTEWQPFYDDIAFRGIKVPIEVLADGTVVDGRHRLKAALALGLADVPIIDAPLNDDTPEEYMIKAALLRRHLTDDQWAAIALLWMEGHKETPPPGPGRGHKIAKTVAPHSSTVFTDRHKTRRRASETFKVSQKKLHKVAQVRQSDPELFESVYKGESTLNKAYQKVDRARKVPELKVQHQVGIRQGDFRQVLLDVSDGSVKLILTDPPYGKNYLPLWNDLGSFAARVLRTDGALIAYSGQLYLPEVIQALQYHLDWWWLSGVAHKGSSNLTPLGQPVRKVINQFKPLIMFVQRKGGLDNVFRDLVDGEGPSKEHHNWGQPIGEAYRILKTFCHIGDLVVDPFAGSGAIGVAATELGLQFIGAEINVPGN